MKHWIIAICLVVLNLPATMAQDRLSTKKGVLQFEASVPSFEEVKAENTAASAILNLKNGDFAALALITGFRFKVALMEEHFNENYMESAKYPKTSFKGSIEGFDYDACLNGKHEWNLNGTLEMHGESRQINVPLILKPNEGHLLLEASFSVKPADFNIKIPKIVSNKIAETVNVNVSFLLK